MTISDQGFSLEIFDYKIRMIKIGMRWVDYKYEISLLSNLSLVDYKYEIYLLSNLSLVDYKFEISLLSNLKPSWL